MKDSLCVEYSISGIGINYDCKLTTFISHCLATYLSFISAIYSGQFTILLKNAIYHPMGLKASTLDVVENFSKL